MGDPRLCIVYAPGEEVFEPSARGLVRRRVREYEVWLADCIEPGKRVMSSTSRTLAEGIGLRLAMSMGLRFMDANAGHVSQRQGDPHE